MSYRKPYQSGDLVVINQWNTLISKFDYKQRLLEVNVAYELNSHENTMAIFENILTASLPDEAEITVKVNINGNVLKNSAKELWEYINKNFDGAKFINKQSLLDKIDEVIDEKKTAKQRYNRIKNFLKSADPRKRLEEYHFDFNGEGHSLITAMKLSLSKLKMIDSFTPKSDYYGYSITSFAEDIKKASIDNKVEKLNYIFTNLTKDEYKENFLKEPYMKEAIATFKLSDLI